MQCGRRRDCSLVGSIIFYNFSGTVDKACHPVFVKVAGAPMTARQLCRHLTRPLGTVTATACRAALANVGTASNYLIAALATESPSLASIGRVLDTLDCAPQQSSRTITLCPTLSKRASTCASALIWQTCNNCRSPRRRVWDRLGSIMSVLRARPQ